VRILGISAYYHDAAAALVDDGVLVAAAQEERFTRKKHDSAFPVHAIRSCLDHAGADISSLDYVTFYDKPFIKFERLLETYLYYAPKGFQSFRMAMPVWLREKMFLKSLLQDELKKLDASIDWNARLLFTEHHQSHAASAFFPSPFDRAAVLTLDGVGEWTTTSTAIGSGNNLEIIKEIQFPHSLGLIYSAFTYYCGFHVNSGEYKLMGLAPYGEPRYASLIRDHIIDIRPDGSFHLDMRYFDYCTGLRMTSEAFHKLFGGPPRDPESLLTQRDMDIAASIQQVLEETVIRLCAGIAAETGERNLCLAGGVALNCVANGKVLRDGKFEKIWIQPAAGDAGGAAGAALSAYFQYLDKPRSVNAGLDAMAGAYLGPVFDDDESESRLKALGAVYDRIDDENALMEQVAQSLADGQAAGWFQGRMEFGPRALGGRSILADPRSPAMQKMLNLKVKYRESFRPFAPAVLAEDVSDWFELDEASPYMLLVADVKHEKLREMTAKESAQFGIDRLNMVRSEIPAVTHVDNSARVQTVHRETNPRFHALLGAFKRITDCPVLINTSFNVRGEPIVCTPEDAFRCFMGTQIECLVIGNLILRKDRQDPALRHKYHESFDLD